MSAFTPSHLNDFVECEHLAALSLAVARGELARPDGDDPAAELVRRKGEAHERAYLESLRAAGKSVLVVDTDDRDWERAAGASADAIRSGSHDVVYQAVLVDPAGWRGVADFVERQPDESYEVADTKLARHPKPYFLLQLSFYSEQVGRIQGRLPERQHVVLGTNDVQAATLLQQWPSRPWLTTNHVRGETWTYLRRKTWHALAARFLDVLERTPRVRVESSAIVSSRRLSNGCVATTSASTPSSTQRASR